MNTTRKLLYALTLSMCALCASFSSQAGTATSSITPAEHVRTEDQTLLTFAEWYMVFSPAEYATYIKDRAPSEFPFLGHIGQLWGGYKATFLETQRRNMALNLGYHLMDSVLATSTSVEYGLRSLYENLIGRISETASGIDTPEDRYAAEVAQDYVDFIRVLPFYQYNFYKKLKGLWSEVPATGPHMLRKWERRYALTTELGIKTVYGYLIKIATGSIYDPALLVTAVHVIPTPQAQSTLPDLKVLTQQLDGSALITVPRYEAFMLYANALAQQGSNFKTIAGNDGMILITLISAQDWTPQRGIEKVLFEQPILTVPGTKRIAVLAKVPELGASLRDWAQLKVQIEHIFDY